MASSGNPFVTNKIPFEQTPLGKDGQFTRPWRDYFIGLSAGMAGFTLEFRDADLIGPQIGAEAFGSQGQTLLIGTGNASDASSDAFVPVFLAAGETFTVPENKQALFAMPIDNEGTLIVDGYLVWVD
jgi:hypothetical protein